MDLITILNHCYPQRGFVYDHTRLSPDKKSIEVIVRPRKGSKAICSGCDKPAPGYDRLAERRFQFIPFWGFLVFFSLLPAACGVPRLRCGGRKTSLGRWQAPFDQSPHAIPGPLGA